MTAFITATVLALSPLVSTSSLVDELLEELEDELLEELEDELDFCEESESSESEEAVGFAFGVGIALSLRAPVALVSVIAARWGLRTWERLISLLTRLLASGVCAARRGVLEGLDSAFTWAADGETAAPERDCLEDADALDTTAVPTTAATAKALTPAVSRCRRTLPVLGMARRGSERCSETSASDMRLG